MKAIVSDPLDLDSMWTVDPEMDVLSGELEASLRASKAVFVFCHKKTWV
jgi:hypothetical protein